MIRLHASSLPRVLACLGSTQYPPLADHIETDSAREGTAAHWVVEQYLRNPQAAIEPTAPNGVPIDDEMLQHAQAYADTIPVFGVSTEYTCDWYATREIEIAVRADAVWYDEPSKTLHVRDYKYGWRIVEAEGNSQLLAGAIGAIRKLAAEGRVFPVDTTIDMGLYQPRPYHPDGPARHWRVTFSELIALHDALVSQLAQLPSDVLNTGEHCEHCPAAVMGTCPAYLLAVNNAVDVATRGSAIELPLPAIGRDLITLKRAAALLKQRLDFAEDIAKRALAADVAALPGWSLEPQHSNKAWTIDGEALKQLTNADVFQPPKLVTPAEAIRRGVSEDVVNANTKRTLTGHKLVRMSADEKVKRAMKVATPDAPKPRKPRAKKGTTAESV